MFAFLRTAIREVETPCKGMEVKNKVDTFTSKLSTGLVRTSTSCTFTLISGFFPFIPFLKPSTLCIRKRLQITEARETFAPHYHAVSNALLGVSAGEKTCKHCAFGATTTGQSSELRFSFPCAFRETIPTTNNPPCHQPHTSTHIFTHRLPACFFVLKARYTHPPTQTHARAHVQEVLVVAL